MPENDSNFDNRAFWNSRYIDNMELGSGVGSRGDNMAHKRKLISSFLEEFQPKSILDVGCGDFEVLSGLDIEAEYLGLDIAPFIIDRNRKQFPGKSFECVNFVELDEVDSCCAGVVLCCEVLIHQHHCADYRMCLENIVRASQTGGLISGYVRDPRPDIHSPIIAWHEPLGETLEDLGAKQIEIRGYSLETDCLAFLSFRS
jgi:ubiquinone/menaquinone biosynthesis C-methylase UbiE